MTHFNVKFRQRKNAEGDYHYWGSTSAGDWTPPTNEWGCIYTSEQCIGLQDKTETDIYVGDIIQDENGHTEVIVFENGSFVHKDYWTEYEGCGGSCWVNREHIQSCKIIGNIGDVFYPQKVKTRIKK